MADTVAQSASWGRHRREQRPRPFLRVGSKFEKVPPDLLKDGILIERRVQPAKDRGKTPQIDLALQIGVKKSSGVRREKGLYMPGVQISHQGHALAQSLPGGLDLL